VTSYVIVKTMRVLFLAFAALSCAALHAQPSQLDLYLMIGQSNMAGRGVAGPEDREPIPGVWAQAKDLSWKPAMDPLHYDKPDIAAVGIGRSFARAVAAARTGGGQVGLIPAAFGGSALDEWKPGSLHYTEAIRRTKAALKNGTLRGILWHQGEADSKDEALARSYVQRFEGFIRQLRADLNAPDVPVVLGELGRFYRNRPNDGAKYAEVVNAQLMKIPDTVPRTAFVSSEGLTDKGDSTHFDTRSLHEFGARYAAAYLKLVSMPTASPVVDNWKASKEFTLAVAQKMPEAEYTFRPVAEEMTFGALMLHIAMAQSIRVAQVAGVTLPIAPPAGRVTKADIMNVLEKSFDFCLATIPKLTSEQLAREHEVNWYEKKSTSGAQIVTAMLVHTAHHRGQAEVYLRLKGIAPPTYRF